MVSKPHSVCCILAPAGTDEGTEEQATTTVASKEEAQMRPSQVLREERTSGPGPGGQELLGELLHGQTQPELLCLVPLPYLGSSHTAHFPRLGRQLTPAFTPTFTPAFTTAFTTASVPSAWMADQLRTCYPHLFPRQC